MKARDKDITREYTYIPESLTHKRNKMYLGMEVGDTLAVTVFDKHHMVAKNVVFKVIKTKEKGYEENI